MDECSPVCKPKKQKLNEEEETEEGTKSISNLPDVVLHFILSLLPTKYAVRTSVLSKRWEYLWTSIFNLEFVEHVSAKGKSLKKSTLKCDVICDASCINSLISSTVRRHVQEFCIDLRNFKEQFALPHCLFTCETLTFLELKMFYILKLPQSICFSTLKSLALWHVRFPNEHSTQQLFSGCPVLKELKLNYCDWVNLRVLSISAPRLMRLTIIEFDTINSSYSDGCQVMIFGTCIYFFHYIGDLWNEYCFSNTSSLEEAWIHTDHWDHRPRQVAYRMYKLLTVLSGVNLLALSSQALQVLTFTPELVANMPMFNNLATLELDPDSVPLDCIALVKILQHSPCLDTLQFNEGITLSTECEKDDAILDAVPPCFLSHLTSILVQMYGGTEKELQAVKILLKNAVVLNKMSISYLEPFPGGLEKQKVRQQLLELPRGSKSCEVEF